VGNVVCVREGSEERRGAGWQVRHPPTPGLNQPRGWQGGAGLPAPLRGVRPRLGLWGGTPLLLLEDVQHAWAYEAAWLARLMLRRCEDAVRHPPCRSAARAARLAFSAAPVRGRGSLSP
jgi:hypothetical protein